MTPIVSILLVTYRNPDLTRECLRSVERETAGQDAEVLVIDNNSPDGTAAMIAAEFPWVDLQASAENLGFARGNNVLASRARGKYVLLLNPDAILHAGALRAILELADQRPEALVYGGRSLRPSGELDPGSCWGFQTIWSLICFATGASRVFKNSAVFDPESLGSWQRDTVRPVDVVTGCLLLMPTAFWHGLGGFDESFWMYGEDQDLAIRAHRAGARPLISPEAVITHVLGASSSPGRKNVMVLGSRVRLMRKHWNPVKAHLGAWLLICGCGLRALVVDPSVGWREGWRRRREWLTEET